MTSDLWARLFRSSEPVASSSASCLRLPKYKARSVAMMAFLMISSTCSYSLEVRLEKILCPSSYGKKEINKKAKAPLMESGSPGELQQSRMGIQEMAVNQLTLLKMGQFLNMVKKPFFCGQSNANCNQHKFRGHVCIDNMHWFENKWHYHVNASLYLSFCQYCIKRKTSIIHF